MPACLWTIEPVLEAGGPGLLVQALFLNTKEPETACHCPGRGGRCQRARSGKASLGFVAMLLPSLDLDHYPETAGSAVSVAGGGLAAIRSATVGGIGKPRATAENTALASGRAFGITDACTCV